MRDAPRRARVRFAGVELRQTARFATTLVTEQARVWPASSIASWIWASTNVGEVCRRPHLTHRRR